ncbi:MAG: hypothetical protein IPP25_22215 [Saprospiraceae bacterium]|nr:hypothetical protein [Candidatus Opimibacter skivensis]
MLRFHIQPLHANTVQGISTIWRLRLGATVDAEVDGQPNATAKGDGADEDGDDDDGVLVPVWSSIRRQILPSMLPGRPAKCMG